MPPRSAAFHLKQLLLVFALLISNTAAGLAGRLAGSLALTAAAVLGALTQVAGLDSLDMFHDNNLHIWKTCSYYAFLFITHIENLVNRSARLCRIKISAAAEAATARG